MINFLSKTFSPFVHAGEATATGGDITIKTVKDATWDVRAKWDHLAISLDMDNGTIEVSIGLCYTYIQCLQPRE